jgi:Fic family protein
MEKELQMVYLVKGTHATTAIEGNSLTEEQVRARVEGRLKLPKSQEYLGKEIDNILNGYNSITDKLLAGPDPAIDSTEIGEYDRQVLDGLELDDGVTPGTYRRHQVTVGRYRGAPADDVEYLTDRLCEWLNSSQFRAPNRDLDVAYAIIKAVVAHVYLAWIHPFADGNGRTARLLEFRILVASGVPLPAAHLLSNHYNLTRADYYRQLEKTSHSNDGDLMPFLCYAVRGFVDQLREQIRLIKSQQWDVTWRSFVHQQFEGLHGETHARRRHLVLDLSQRDRPVPRSQLREVSPRVASDYSGRTDKTMTRDLNELIKMKLVLRTPTGYASNRATILAFLPARATQEVPLVPF